MNHSNHSFGQKGTIHLPFPFSVPVHSQPTRGGPDGERFGCGGLLMGLMEALWILPRPHRFRVTNSSGNGRDAPNSQSGMEK